MLILFLGVAMHPFFRRYGFPVLFMLFVASLAAAQQPTGSITGTVVDPSGAVIANARVTITRTATGSSVETATSDGGIYFVGSLLPGPYDIRVEARDFKTTRTT